MNGQLVFHLGLPVYCLVISVIQLPLQLCQEHLAAIWEVNNKHMYEWYSQYMKFGSRKVYLLNYSVLCCQNVKQNSCQSSCWINRQFTINPTSCNSMVRRIQNDEIKLHAFCWIWVCCCWRIWWMISIDEAIKPSYAVAGPPPLVPARGLNTLETS